MEHGTGALVDFKDPRDYQYSDIARAGTPFDWTLGFDVEQGFKINLKDQDGSSSCGGQAWAYYGQVLDNDHDEKSAKFIYGNTAVAGGGSAGRTNSEFVKTKGWGLEKLTPSYLNGNPAPEEFYLQKDISEEAYKQALTDKALSYAYVNASNSDELSMAIKDNHRCVIGIEGQNNGTWLSKFPKPPVGTSGIWRHWVYVGKMKLIDGKKYFGFINSWGNVGEDGWQWIGEEYLPHTFGGWTLIYDKQITLLVQTLRYGSRGEQVKILQKFLGCEPDGIFGNITKRLTTAWQLSHGLVGDGIVGPLTRAKINPLL